MVVLLQVPDEPALLVLASRVSHPHVLVTESDPPYTGQATALGFLPVTDRTELKKVLSNLPLYMGQRQRKPLTAQADSLKCEADPPHADLAEEAKE